MNDIQLTEHFMLSEFVNSSTAKARGIDNTIPESLIPSVKNLCEQVLEPLREHLGFPVVIGSGYRCPALNSAVGGVKNSQHKKGEAADIHLPVINGKTDVATGRNWMRWIINETDFDQCIFETADHKRFWIHVSCKPDLSQNRHHVISYLLKK